MSFRMSGEFMEDLTNRMAQDLIKLLDPIYIEVYAKFVSRGDILLQPYVHSYHNNSIGYKDIVNNLLDRYQKLKDVT